MKKKVLFIMGIGRSGSTLLNYMLGSHPECFELNEISKLPEIYRNKERNQSFWEGPGQFWEEKFREEELKMLVEGFGDRRLNPYLPLKVEKFLRGLVKNDPMFNPYSLIFSKVKENILIDSTKYIYWVSKRLKSREFREGLIEPYIVHLVRDGRAVLNSYLRWDKSLTVEKFSDRFLKEITACQEFYANFPEERKMMVRYEKLAGETEETLKSVCQMLGIEFIPDIIEYWKQEHYGIVGNFGTRSLIAKYKQQQVEQKVEKIHGNYYEEQGFAIKLDLRWKQELAPEKVEEFYSRIGDLNKPYEWNE